MQQTYQGLDAQGAVIRGPLEQGCRARGAGGDQCPDGIAPGCCVGLGIGDQLAEICEGAAVPEHHSQFIQGRLQFCCAECLGCVSQFNPSGWGLGLVPSFEGVRHALEQIEKQIALPQCWDCDRFLPGEESVEKMRKAFGTGFQLDGQAACDELAQRTVDTGLKESERIAGIDCDGGFDALPEQVGKIVIVGFVGVLDEFDGDGGARGDGEMLESGGEVEMQEGFAWRARQ